jgi:hypothetical protein
MEEYLVALSRTYIGYTVYWSRLIFVVLTNMRALKQRIRSHLSALEGLKLETDTSETQAKSFMP